MERALVAEDPKLASTLRGGNFGAHPRRRLVVAVGAFVVGVTVLMTGAVMQVTLVGIAGFVTMLVSAYLGLAMFRSPTVTAESHPADHASGFKVIDGGKSSKKRRPAKQASLMERFEQRWHHRRDDGGF
jgi:hypothetical protein